MSKTDRYTEMRDRDMQKICLEQSEIHRDEGQRYTEEMSRTDRDTQRCRKVMSYTDMTPTRSTCST